MRNEEGVFVHPYLTKATAHNQLLVERVPAGRVFLWCELSIRSEELKHEEACVEDWTPTQRTREGCSHRDLRGICSRFPLYLQFSASLFPAAAAPVAVELIHQFSSFHSCCLLSLHRGRVWGGGTAGEMGLRFPPVLFSLSFCVSGLPRGLCKSWRLLLQIWFLKWVKSPSPLFNCWSFACSFEIIVFLGNNKLSNFRYQMDWNCY